jgi:MFS family permease
MFLIDVLTALFALVLIGFFVKENKLIDKDSNGQDLGLSPMESHHEGSIFCVLLERPILIKFALLMFLYRMVYAQWSFLMPLHAVGLYGDMAGGALYGNLGMVNALIVVSLTAIITRMFMKISSIHRIVIAGIFLSLGFGLLGIVARPAAFYVSVFIFTLGEIIEAISTMPFIMNHTPVSHRARMSSVIMMVMGVGYSSGPLVVGWILSMGSYSRTWRVIALIGFVGVFGMWRLSRSEARKSLGKLLDET